MAPLVPLDYAILSFRHTITGDSEQMYCTIGLQLDNPRTVTDQSLVNSCFDLYKIAMDSSLTAQTTMVGATLQRQSILGFVTTDSTTATAVGTSSGSALPPNCAALIEKNTSRGGRSGKGRMFLPGFNEAGVDPSGFLVGANLTQLNTDAAALFVALNAAADVVTAVLFHEASLGSPDPDVITSLSADAKIATQRRRLR